ncbi:MAG TPA: hypothetical protein VKE74_13060 [Gemmataceae bacterium]|nr:hypothetical protein [Gemmataceae bacterium]
MTQLERIAPPDPIVARVEQARALLAEARDATDAKKVADLARAAEVYMKRQKLSEEVIASATAVKVDVMTLMGEMLKATEKNTGAAGRGEKGAKRGSLVEPPIETPTLADLGISKKESSDAQTLATLKEEAPELHEQVKAGKATVAKARVEARRQEERVTAPPKLPDPPPHPFVELLSAIHSLSRAMTTAVRGEDEASRRLHDYLAAAGLLDHPPPENKPQFLPLRGVRGLVELAGDTGPKKSDREVRAVYDRASGGFLPPLIARRRRQRGAP